ncbi:MAG: pseudaminic acid cytidylyltransferase [Ekhidna sp.]
MKIAIIPARSGSKRIPNKNIKTFCGKPIIAYSIHAAISTGLFDEVIVSTDHSDIANIAVQYGASVPFLRSNENSNDHATILDVMHEVVSWYDSKGMSLEICCGIYATAPFIRSEDLVKSYQKLVDEKRDSVLAIGKFPVPIQKAFKMNDGKISWFFDNFDLDRTQDLSSSYQDAAQFFWFNTAKFKRSGLIIGTNTGGYEIDQLAVQDIDTQEDWEMAEFKYQFLKSRNERGN